jgi:hypothetical protein
MNKLNMGTCEHSKLGYQINSTVGISSVGNIPINLKFLWWNNILIATVPYN